MDFDFKKYIYDAHLLRASEEAKNILNTSNVPPHILNDIIGLHKPAVSIPIGTSVLEDLGLTREGSTFKALDKTHTQGGSLLLSKLLGEPAFRSVIPSPTSQSAKLAALAQYEQDVLWALSIDATAISKPPLNSLYPSTQVINTINQSPQLLAVYHFYRAFGAPTMAILSPTLSFLGPYWFLRYKMGLKIGLWAYIVIVAQLVWQLLASGGSTWYIIGRYLGILFYALVFIYNIINTVCDANIVRRLRNEMSKKVQNIGAFIRVSNELFGGHDITISTLSDLYRLFKSPEKKATLRQLLLKVYDADVNAMCNRYLEDMAWCIPVMDSKAATRFWGMKHVAIEEGRSNPASLAKNLIVTGPNAGGKSTFVKSILLNILLSHSLGIANAYKAEVLKYDAIHSYMRIWDSPGEESLFEAEISRCKTIVETAQALSAAGKQGVFFLDEPMHSTPPTEGAATAKAIVKYMGELPGIRIVVCTHFHSITGLETPLFQNVSMSATKNSKTAKYDFAYKLHPGPSFQCIALDLLSERSLPREILDSAKGFLARAVE